MSQPLYQPLNEQRDTQLFHQINFIGVLPDPNSPDDDRIIQPVITELPDPNGLLVMMGEILGDTGMPDADDDNDNVQVELRVALQVEHEITDVFVQSQWIPANANVNQDELALRLLRRFCTLNYEWVLDASLSEREQLDKMVEISKSSGVSVMGDEVQITFEITPLS